MFELSDSVVWVMGLIISALVFFFKMWQTKTGKEISKKFVAGLLYALSFVVVLAFGVFIWPVFPLLPVFPSDPVGFFGVLVPYIGLILGYAVEWLTLLTVIVGLAVVPYEFLYKGVFERFSPPPKGLASPKE